MAKNTTAVIKVTIVEDLNDATWDLKFDLVEDEGIGDAHQRGLIMARLAEILSEEGSW